MSTYFGKTLVNALMSGDPDRLALAIDEFARHLMSIPGDNPTISLEQLKTEIARQLKIQVESVANELKIAHLDFKPAGENE